MSNKYLNDLEEVEHIGLIKETALKVWAKNVKFYKIKGINSPYPEFEWDIRLYNMFNIKLIYDRSILCIEVLTGEEYMELSRITDERIYHFFDSLKPENLLHNFQVLDRLLIKQMV